MTQDIVASGGRIRPGHGSALLITLFSQKMEFLYVLDLSQLTSLFDAIIFPLVGGLALLLAKLSQGDAARWAERQFIAVLLVITIVTLRTVITCHEFWLVHTMSLGTLIICSLMVPGQQDTTMAV